MSELACAEEVCANERHQLVTFCAVGCNDHASYGPTDVFTGDGGKARFLRAD